MESLWPFSTGTIFNHWGILAAISSLVGPSTRKIGFSPQYIMTMTGWSYLVTNQSTGYKGRNAKFA